MDDAAPRRRSVPVTALAWLLMAASAPLLPVSLISLLMLVVGSDGTQSATVAGALAVVGGPPATLLAGFGLWRRWRWAHVAVLLLLAGVALQGVARMARGPIPASTYVTPAGVLTHVAASDGGGPLAVAALLGALAAAVLLLTPAVRAEFFPPRSRAPGRPRTASRGGGLRGASGVAERAGTPRTQGAAAPASQRRAGIVALLLVLTLAGGMAWLVVNGVGSGVTFLPTRHGVARRVVERAAEPATFWLSIGTYAAVGAGSIGLAAWGLYAALRRNDH